MSKHSFLRAFAAAALLAAFGSAHAQPAVWPEKPVKIINPFAPGGGVDAFARPLAAKLAQQLGVNFVVENQGGAGGTLGATTASKASPDGYTFFAGAIHHAIGETLYTNLQYGIEKNFSPVTVLAFVPNVIVVHPKHPFKSLNELIAYARANPGVLNFGSAGNGTSHHLVGELFKLQTGTDLTHVPYKGAGPMMTDLLGGQVDLAFDGMSTSAAPIKAGRLRPLAVTTATRSFIVPDVPTMMESGFKDFEVTTWYAIWAVKGTPQPIIDKMYAEVVKAINSPELKNVWEQQGATAGGMPPAEFGKFLHGEIDKWGKVVRASKLKIDL
ncbi:ABC transporter substrate-binding protein [Betaproteobacteria bacterium GR16-43]|nr:ABC transporter substrate-binding protein [Betaproteobacteria bacterium GR16-43]